MGKYGWIDSHAHLSDESLHNRMDEVQNKCKENDVERILAICLSFKEVEEAFVLKEKYTNIDIAVGFFPTEVHAKTDADYQKLESVAKDERVVAIGEIGLDHYWEKENDQREIQKAGFKRQIEIAKRVNKPILVHSRDAAKETVDVLKEMDHYGAIHCYSYSAEVAIELVKLGYMISLAGPITFKNAKEPKEVAKVVPLDMLLIETDSPYLTPEPFRGKKNEPAYVKYVGELISELKEVPCDVLQEAVHNNYYKLFHKHN